MKFKVENYTASLESENATEMLTLIEFWKSFMNKAPASKWTNTHKVPADKPPRHKANQQNCEVVGCEFVASNIVAFNMHYLRGHGLQAKGGKVVKNEGAYLFRGKVYNAPFPVAKRADGKYYPIESTSAAKAQKEFKEEPSKFFPPVRKVKTL